MSTVNLMAREIAAKIVFYGPGLSGKTTTLKRVYDSVKPAHRGELMSLPTEADRTLFFDFLPVKVERVGEATVRLALYTVPGQVFYNATRKLVLQNADGVVFVADSQQAMMDSNLESMDNLRINLNEMGLVPSLVPLTIQYNKRDLENILPVEELRAKLNPDAVPDFETVANRGKGVMEALRATTRAVIKNLKAKGVMLSSPRQRTPVPSLSDRAGPSLSSQIAEVTGGPPEDGGLLAVLLPGNFLADAELIESAFREGRHAEAVLRAMTALRGCLKSMGTEAMSEVELALMAGLTGPDFARLLRVERDEGVSREDAAFVLLMLALVGVRVRR